MSNTDNNDDDGAYTGPAWYRPGKNRDLFLGLLVLFLLVGFGGALSQCEAGRDLAGRFGFDTGDGGDELDLIADGGGTNDADDSDVRRALDNDSFEDIDEDVDGNSVVLTGVVASQALKDDAEDSALSVDGIDDVDNQIEVEEVRDLAQEIRDSHEDDGIEGVAVEVDNNVATLTGTVADQATKDRAEELALEVEGIDEVNNELIIEEEPQPEPDPEVTTTTTEAEAAPPPPPPAADPYAVTGTVTDGVVTLTGAVQSEDVRNSLVEAMGTEIGPDNVVDEMTIDDALGEEGTITLVGETEAEAAEAIAQAAGNAADAVGGEVVDQIEVAAVEPPSDLPSNLNQILQADPILFEVNSAVIVADSEPIVQQVASILIENPDGKLIVEGHTDSDGNDAANLQLSQNRAESVRTALVELGVASDRLSALGRGETVPVLVGGVEDKDQSRRIEFQLQGEDG